MVVVFDTGRLGSRDEAREHGVLPDPHLPVERVGPAVVAVLGESADADTVGKESADRRSVRQIAADSDDGEITARQAIVLGVDRDVQQLDVVGLHVQQADVELAGLARHAPAAVDRNGLARRTDPDPTTEEQLDLAGIADREEAGVLQEERALLREEQIEAIEVDLLIVDLDLREIGVDGAVEREARRQAVLDVHSGIAVELGIGGTEA